MVQIANISHLVQRFTDKDGGIVEIDPGASQDVNIDKDDPRVWAKENARLIVVGGTEKQAAKVAREKSPVTAGSVPVPPKADEPTV